MRGIGITFSFEADITALWYAAYDLFVEFAGDFGEFCFVKDVLCFAYHAFVVCDMWCGVVYFECDFVGEFDVAAAFLVHVVADCCFCYAEEEGDLFLCFAEIFECDAEFSSDGR